MENTPFRKRLFRVLLGMGAGIALVAVFSVLVTKGFGIPCLFYTITGLQCPGCGNTRAALALLRLDFTGALAYNALFPLEFGYLLWVLLQWILSYLRGKSYHPRHIWLHIAVLVTVLVWGVLRNIL